MHSLVAHLNPALSQDLKWDYRDINNLIPAAVHHVTNLFNETEFHSIIGPLRSKVSTDEQTGIEYALYADKLSSESSAILHFNPFANGMDDNMLLRAEYLARVFRGFGIVDSHGINIPLLTFSAPSGSRNIKLTANHRKSLSCGDFSSLAKEYLKIVKRYGFSSVKIIGFSQGATLAAAVAAEAPSLGIKVSHLAIGEPANIMKRSRQRLARDFNASAKHLNTSIDAAGIEHFKRFYVKGFAVRYTLGLVRMGRLNMSLASGLGKATFKTDLHRVLDHDTVITIGWGGLNTIGPAAKIESLVTESRKTKNLHYHAIHTIDIANAHHTWADSLNVLSMFYAYSLLR